MSTLLYRLGRAAYGRAWWVLGAWAVVISALAAVLVISPPQLSSEIRIDGTPAQSVVDDLAVKVPAAAGGQGLIAFQAPGGVRIDDGENRAALVAAVSAVYDADHVLDARELLAQEAAKGEGSLLLSASTLIAQQAAPPEPGAPAPLVVDGQPLPGVMVSADGSAALFQFQFDAQTFELPTGTVEDVVGAAEQAVTGTGIEVLPSQSMIQIPELIGVGEVIGVLIAGLVLLMTLGSLIAAGLPLASALSGVAVGIGGAFALSSLFSIHSLAAVLALMLGLAVGIDYALFIVNRQRRLILDLGLSAGEAAGRAIGTAGNAVVFAGSTVVIALLALMVVRIHLLSVMALVAAGTVVIAVASALTLLPAMLGLVGERICRPQLRAHAADKGIAPHPVATAWAGQLTRHPWLAVLGVVIATGMLAFPTADMELGLPSGASYNTGSPQRESYDVTAEEFGPGFNGPLVVVVTAPAAFDAGTLAQLDARIGEVPGVAATNLGGLSGDGTTAVYAVLPTTGPTDSATADVVTRLRDLGDRLGAEQGVTAGVTGFAALGIDISDRLADVFPTYVAVVVVLSLMVLLLVFRSIVVPIKATAGFLLSVGATFGVTTAVFQWGWVQQLIGIDATGPILSLLPIILVGVLYGLAMDYEVFLVSSMKEAHVHGEHGRPAIVHGFALASRVVVAAAIIMTSVFAGFVFNADPMIKQFGFALAVGILIDAFLVRMTLVPAAMAIFGDRAWWLPGWLDRILPDLDVEGDKLAKQLEGEQGA